MFPGRIRAGVVGLVLAAGCSGGPGSWTIPDGSTGSTEDAAFVARFVGPLPTALTSGEVFAVEVEVVDKQTGERTTGYEGDLEVFNSAAGLEGTLERPVIDGLATFDDLVLRTCATTVLYAHAFRAVDTGASDPIAVTPLAEVLSAPGPAAATGRLDPVVLSLDHADGPGIEGLFELRDTGSEGVSLVADPATVDRGVLTFDGLVVEGTGTLALAVAGLRGCPLEIPLPEIWVGDTVTTEPVFLPAARVGEDYTAALPYDEVLLHEPPGGLAPTGGILAGVPEESAAWLLRAAARDGDDVVDLQVRLPVLPADDADLPAPVLDPSEDGPWATDAVELTVPAITTSRGATRDVAVRVAFPGDGAGGVAEGRFPVVAFHHAAHSPTDIYDDYTELHGHWASHGVIVASVDSSVNVSGVSQSWQDLVDMSTFQLATVDLLAALDADETSLFFGHVAVDRVFVSGHGGGGGASLISLWREPSLLGAIALEPVSPLQTPSQTWSDPDGNGDRAFPVRPILLVVGALDADEPWPLVDLSYEQTVGPAALVTIHGANHEDSYDADTPGDRTSTSTIGIPERHAIDQHYTTAFLRRYGGAGRAAGDLAWELPLYGSEALGTTLSVEGVSVHGRRYAARTATIDDFQDQADENLFGGSNVGTALDRDANDEPYAAGLAAVGRYDERGTRIGQWARARLVDWSTPGAELALFLGPDGDVVDLSAHHALVLRLARDCPPPSAGECPDLAVDVGLGLWDADGHQLTVPLAEHMGDRGIVGRHWSTARIDLDALPGLDLTRVEGVVVDLSSHGWDSGALWLDDLRVE